MHTDSELIDRLVVGNNTKIIFFIMDGIGGLHMSGHPGTELQMARTPNLDSLAKKSSCGLLTPIIPGVTPGSGPGHFALFGYDPVENNIGRGVLEAAGICFDLSEDDVVARGNFATVDRQGNITDRRAGRISTDENKRLCTRLREAIRLKGVELFIEPLKEHRFLVVFRAGGLEGDIADTDPQSTGVPPLDPVPLKPGSADTAELIRDFLQQVASTLSDEPRANTATLRGFGKYRRYPTVRERFKLKSLCLANYPMYRGVCYLIGMDLNPVTQDFEAQLEALERDFSRYDFVFLHAKTTDATGEDGNFEAKVRAIEELDARLPRIANLKPDVLVITGDHSTPSALRSHSWHPVPVLLHSRYARSDPAKRLTELECLKGALGQMPARHLMGVALAHALRLTKFGA